MTPQIMQSIKHTRRFLGFSLSLPWLASKQELRRWRDLSTIYAFHKDIYYHAISTNAGQVNYVPWNRKVWNVFKTPAQTAFFSITTFTKSQYIHPLSQIVLTHLQSQHSDWVKRMGLEQGLQLNSDGTFVLRFPTSMGTSHNNDIEGETTESIWTMYEPNERKHYLCISRNIIVGRYMLQDNAKQAWHLDRRSTPQRVQDAVNEMIQKIS